MQKLPSVRRTEHNLEKPTTHFNIPYFWPYHTPYIKGSAGGLACFHIHVRCAYQWILSIYIQFCRTQLWFSSIHCFNLHAERRRFHSSSQYVVDMLMDQTTKPSLFSLQQGQDTFLSPKHLDQLGGGAHPAACSVVKWLRHKTGYTLPCNAKDKTEWRYTSTPLICLYGMVLN